jgi:hypothetical protein
MICPNIGIEIYPRGSLSFIHRYFMTVASTVKIPFPSVVLDERQ